MSNNQQQTTATVLSSLKDIHSVYFIGIGGIGMSALARYFISKGVVVSGYDKTETELTKKLAEEGIPVYYTEDVNRIPKDVDLVVYTPAIPKQQAELVYYQNNNYKDVKRSDVLGAISADTFNICVAGTHGKTTVSTMIAHVLRDSGYGCNAFLGGISTNYGTNFWSDPNNVSVIEADEYDRSFLKLSPDISVITAMDADHLDIYGDEATMKQAFVEFGSKLKKGGLLISRFGLSRVRDIDADNKWSYSTSNEAATVYASDVRIQDGGYVFNIQFPGVFVTGFRLNMGGMHNVENAIAAIAVAYQLKIDVEKIKDAIASFRGVRRRFEYVLPAQSQASGSYTYPVLIDDYAHHPEELAALLKSTRSLFPQRKMTVIFQPHLFSRTKDFANEFSASLDIADRIILLPIYPARELPIEGVTSEIILKNIKHNDKHLLSKDELLDWARNYLNGIDKEFGEVIVVAGAGDIDKLVMPLKEIFAKA